MTINNFKCLMSLIECPYDKIWEEDMLIFYDDSGIGYSISRNEREDIDQVIDWTIKKINNDNR